jgi:hypothetical protein
MVPVAAAATAHPMEWLAWGKRPTKVWLAWVRARATETTGQTGTGTDLPTVTVLPIHEHTCELLCTGRALARGWSGQPRCSVRENKVSSSQCVRFDGVWDIGMVFDH